MPYLGISSGAILDPTLDAKRNVLEFWALTTREFDLRPNVNSGSHVRTFYEIHNAAGLRCGIRYGGHHLPDEPNTPIVLECVLLSTLFLKDSFLEVFKVDETAISDKNHYSLTKRCLVNVILIEWRGDFVERVGLCQIHKDAWDVTKPEKKLIRLM